MSTVEEPAMATVVARQSRMAACTSLLRIIELSSLLKSGLLEGSPQFRESYPILPACGLD
jgi:hypothetical protein